MHVREKSSAFFFFNLFLFFKLTLWKVWCVFAAFYSSESVNLWAQRWSAHLIRLQTENRILCWASRFPLNTVFRFLFSKIPLSSPPPPNLWLTQRGLFVCALVGLILYDINLPKVPVNIKLWSSFLFCRCHYCCFIPHLIQFLVWSFCTNTPIIK